jgi:hypothetical protein
MRPPTGSRLVRIALTWPGDLDFDPDTLIWGDAPPPEAGVRPAPFLKLPRPSPSAA